MAKCSLKGGDESSKSDAGQAGGAGQTSLRDGNWCNRIVFRGLKPTATLTTSLRDEFGFCPPIPQPQPSCFPLS